MSGKKNERKSDILCLFVIIISKKGKSEGYSIQAKKENGLKMMEKMGLYIRFRVRIVYLLAFGIVRPFVQ